MIATITPATENHQRIPGVGCGHCRRHTSNWYCQHRSALHARRQWNKIDIILQATGFMDDQDQSLMSCGKCHCALAKTSLVWHNVDVHIGRPAWPVTSNVCSQLFCLYAIITFITIDHPLRWKALQVIQNQPENSQLCSIVLRLGHTQKSFVGSMGGSHNLWQSKDCRNSLKHSMPTKCHSHAEPESNTASSSRHTAS